MTTSSVKLFTLCVVLVFLSTSPGCKYIECGEYQKYVSNDGRRGDLIKWVDENIFNRQFLDKDLRSGGVVGPGGKFKSISIERSGIYVPEWLREYEIRILGPDQYRPNAIFIGRHRYQGLIVTRGGMEDSLVGTDVIVELLDMKSDRVAVMCYQEKENMMDKRAFKKK